MKTDFSDYIFENGRDYMDLVDLHIYGCVEDTPAKVEFVRKNIEKFGYTKPIRSTEIGEVDIQCQNNPQFIDSFDSLEELKLQSEQIVKKHVLAFSSGV